MGQKINPNIFRLGNTKNWKSNYFEKKIVEFPIYANKDLELRCFILQLFKNHKIIISNHKINYFNNSLYLFISCYKEFNQLWFYNSFKKTKQILVEKFLDKQKVKKLKFLVKKKSFYKLKKIFKLLEVPKIKSFINNFYNKNDFLVEKIEKVLKNFTKKKFNIFLVMQKINDNLDKLMTEKNQEILKKKLTSLRKYEQNNFFYEGINILFTCSINKKPSRILAQCLAVELIKLKRHNFFFKFVKNSLMLFSNYNWTRFKGIKIRIKGRVHNRPRAYSKFIEVRYGIPASNINSKIDYFEETAFTSNGTLGIKVWVYESKNIE